MGLAIDFPGNQKIKQNLDCKAYTAIGEANMWDTIVSMKGINN